MITSSRYQYSKHGIFYPTGDEDAYRTGRVRKRLKQAEDSVKRASSFCARKRVVVQAGGHWGLWPRQLADVFSRVYTFEPNPLAFGALALNTLDLTNVYRYAAALGASRGMISLEVNTRNYGGTRVVSEGGRFRVPVVLVDDLGLDACDLIYLDVEGYEFQALLGAENTLLHYKPVIAFESKGLAQRYGYTGDDVQAWLSAVHGYKVVDKFRYDLVMSA